MKTQKPGEKWIFKNKKTGEQDIGVLPSRFGESNDFAQWQSVPVDRPGHPSKRGGAWKSKKFDRQRRTIRFQGKGSKGLLSRMKSVISSSKFFAVRDGHGVPISDTPEELVRLWLSQNGMCYLCRGPLSIVGSSCDHSHKSGKVRGFVHKNCNTVQGMTEKLSDKEFETLVESMRWIRVGDAFMFGVNQCEPTTVK